MKELAVLFIVIAVFSVFSANETVRGIKRKISAPDLIFTAGAAALSAAGMFLSRDILILFSVPLWVLYSALYTAADPGDFEKKSVLLLILAPAAAGIPAAGWDEYVFFTGIVSFTVIMLISAMIYRQLRASDKNTAVPAVFAVWPVVYLYRAFLGSFPPAAVCAAVFLIAVVFHLYRDRGIDYYIDGKRFYNTIMIFYVFVIIQGFAAATMSKNPLFLYLVYR
ncbi:MAG: hypothetical protein ACLFP1_03215 [Candidatus Goldiibacteriota bacterium]